MVTEEERKSSHILGLWESVFPPVLSMGDPKRHHIVVYLHITLGKTSEQLNKEFKVRMYSKVFHLLSSMNILVQLFHRKR